MVMMTETAPDAWLRQVSGDIQAGRWASRNAPKPAKPVTLRAYADAWLAERELSPSTRRLYRVTLDTQVLPALGDVPVTQLSPSAVRKWHASLMQSTGPTQRAHAYSLLRTILNTALADEIPANPCRVRGAGQAKRARQIKPASVAELEALVQAMPERYRLMVLLAAWCALRFGELAELRRSDIDVRNGVVHVRRGVIRADDGRVVKDPKSEAGKRDVAIPPHLRDHVAASRDALCVPRSQRRPHGPVQPLRGVPPGARQVRPARPAVLLPAPHRGGAGRRDRGHAGRADGPARALHRQRGDALPARRW